MDSTSRVGASNPNNNGGGGGGGGEGPSSATASGRITESEGIELYDYFI